MFCATSWPVVPFLIPSSNINIYRPPPIIICMGAELVKIEPPSLSPLTCAHVEKLVVRCGRYFVRENIINLAANDPFRVAQLLCVWNVEKPQRVHPQYRTRILRCYLIRTPTMLEFVPSFLRRANLNASSCDNYFYHNFLPGYVIRNIIICDIVFSWSTCYGIRWARINSRWKLIKVKQHTVLFLVSSTVKQVFTLFYPMWGNKV